MCPALPPPGSSALDRWGTRSLAQSLRPAASLAAARVRRRPRPSTSRPSTTRCGSSAIRPTRRLFLPGGEPPAVGSTFRNPDLAADLPADRRRGLAPALQGRSPTRSSPPCAVRRRPSGAELPVPPGYMRSGRPRPLRRHRPPADQGRLPRLRTSTACRRPSSGGIAVGEALNILERFDVGAHEPPSTRCTTTSRPARSRSPTGASTSATPTSSTSRSATLLSDRFAAERACSIVPGEAQPKPFPPGDVDDYDGVCARGRQPATRPATTRACRRPTSPSPTAGATSSSTPSPSSRPAARGIVVPGRGFILNNELTDFSLEYDADDPNRIQRRQAAAQLDVADDRARGRQAVPGARLAGRRHDHHHRAADAGQPDRPGHDDPAGDGGAARVATQRHADRRPSSRSATPTAPLLEAYGHDFTPIAELGAATAIEFGPGRRLTAVAEPVRRGGGAAAVVSLCAEPRASPEAHVAQWTR